MAKKRQVILKRFFDESGAQMRERQHLLRSITEELARMRGIEDKQALLVVSYFIHYAFGSLEPGDALMLEDVL